MINEMIMVYIECYEEEKTVIFTLFYDEGSRTGGGAINIGGHR